MHSPVCGPGESLPCHVATSSHGQFHATSAAGISSLTLCGRMLQQKGADQWLLVITGQAATEPEVQRLVSTLISLSSYEAMDMRACSLQCLVSVMDLPYHLLHPLRKQVLTALALRVDDHKRRVRQEAVKCLKVWSNA